MVALPKLGFLSLASPSHYKTPQVQLHLFPMPRLCDILRADFRGRDNNKYVAMILVEGRDFSVSSLIDSISGIL